MKRSRGGNTSAWETGSEMERTCIHFERFRKRGFEGWKKEREKKKMAK